MGEIFFTPALAISKSGRSNNFSAVSPNGRRYTHSERSDGIQSQRPEDPHPPLLICVVCLSYLVCPPSVNFSFPELLPNGFISVFGLGHELA